MKLFLSAFGTLALFLLSGITAMVKAQSHNIKNDTFWNATDGSAIRSQGGGIFRFTDPASGITKYYWYGVYYEEADLYRNDPVRSYSKCTFKSVTCYSSDDLVNWSFEADVLTKDAVAGDGRTGWVGRLGVCYVKELNKYALLVQHNNKVMIALADKPTGKFTLHQEISMQQMIGTSNTGDQTVFTEEETGKSYLVYSYGKGRNKIYVSEIGVKEGMVNLLDCTKVFQGESREGNCMFKYKGKYYMCASNIYGWDASFAYYLVADDIRGPYTPANDMQVMKGCAEDFAHISQTGFFITVKGSKQDLVVYCGDRWADFAGNGNGYNQWVPITFEGITPFFNSLHSWDLDAQTGEWKVAADNDYVKNGSFEADRRKIPSPVKPVQEYLSGWVTTVTEGNRISLDSTTSPVLNYFNSEEDRKIVTGEKSMYISDRVSFKRNIAQTISATPFVKLPDGVYTLTAKVKNSNGFTTLQMYALSDSKTTAVEFKEEHQSWKTISIEKLIIKGGKVEIGFNATGVANAVCEVDDVSLVKVK